MELITEEKINNIKRNAESKKLNIDASIVQGV